MTFGFAGSGHASAVRGFAGFGSYTPSHHTQSISAGYPYSGYGREGLGGNGFGAFHGTAGYGGRYHPLPLQHAAGIEGGYGAGYSHLGAPPALEHGFVGVGARYGAPATGGKDGAWAPSGPYSAYPGVNYGGHGRVRAARLSCILFFLVLSDVVLFVVLL